MNTNIQIIIVNDIEVQVVRKNIKNLHLSVHPPEGHVRVSVPMHITADNVRLAVISRLNWITKQQAMFEGRPRQSKREMVTGESHYLFGKRYRLEVVERRGRHEVDMKSNTKLLLYVNPGTTIHNRQTVINEWYRSELKKLIPVLIAKWKPVISKQVAEWGVKKMKTRWGSCNIKKNRIWFNLELAKIPVECLEFVLVHEMVHLYERNHNDRFESYMDKFLPNWRFHRETLNRAPLSHADWSY